MIKKFTAFLFCLLFIPALSYADKRPLGVGFILGEPTGLSMKYNLGPTTAIDGGAAWSFSGKDSFHLHSDLLFHTNNLFSVQNEDIRTNGFDLYYGAGLRLKFNDGDDSFGIRAPIGLEYLFHDAHLGVFFEFAGILDLTPDTDFNINAGIGLRYFF
ncbi:MAG: hypothetical protein KDD46_04040 [Bdellovibrionales bacterium]|nr:hypothetical protein [Bdellovibrionales bacterium]